jgi:hypothetical protein
MIVPCLWQIDTFCNPGATPLPADVSGVMEDYIRTIGTYPPDRHSHDPIL